MAQVVGTRKLLEVKILEAKGCGISTSNMIQATLLDFTKNRIESTQQTKVVKTENPCFNEVITFGKDYEFHDDVPPTLYLELLDKGYFQTDTRGLVTIPCDTIPNTAPYQPTKPTWYTFKAKKLYFKASKGDTKKADKSVSGDVKLKVQLCWKLPEGVTHGANEPDLTAEFDGADIDEKEEEPNLLLIRIINARQLRVMDGSMYGGSADPRVVIKLDGKVAKDRQNKDTITEVKKKDLKPVWNETFQIPVGPNNDGSAPPLEFIVEDHDQHLGNINSYEFMGRTQMNLQTMMNHEFSMVEEKLKDKNGRAADKELGFLQFAVQWIYDPDVILPEKKGGGFFGGVFGSQEEEVEDVEEEEEDTGGSAEKTEAEIAKEQEELQAAKDKQKALQQFEVKSGDYQVQVHIIECRELKAKDDSGTSDPVVTIECFGEKQNSSVKEQTLNCVFDELFIFNKRNLDKEEFEEEVIKVSVMDADFGTRNEMIGSYQVDATFVYYREHHELYRTWVGLVNDEDIESVEVQGYMRISIQIVGPGDKLYVHNEAEDKKKEKEAEKDAGGGIAGMVIMPPAIKREIMWLRTTVSRAEYLPCVDGGIGGSGIDAQYTINHGSATNKKSTKCITCKGTDRAKLSPNFNYEIWLPVTVPTSSQTIKCTLEDVDPLSTNLVASSYFKWDIISALTNKKMGPFWQPLYGAAINLPEQVKLAVKASEAAGTAWTSYYNRYPESSSTYRGRVLLTHQILGKDSPLVPNRKEVTEKRAWRRKIKAKNVEPPSQNYVLSAVVVSGTELPEKGEVGITNIASKNQKMKVSISCGKYEAHTKQVANTNGVSEWFELLSTEDENMVYPKDITQVPDIFIHLWRGKTQQDLGNPLLPVSFWRISAKDLIEGRVGGEEGKVDKTQAAFEKTKPTWITLREDKSLDECKDGQFPGNVLIMLGFGLKDAWADHKDRWHKMAQAAQERVRYQLRVHLYQARDLPDADFIGGGIDPYFNVSYNGQVNKGRDEYIPKNNDPLVYRTIVMDDVTVPPDVNFLPQVNIQVWDWDFGGQDYIGCCFHTFTEDEILDGSDADPDAPDGGFPIVPPTWIDLLREEEGDCEGAVLASFQLIKVMVGKTLPPPPPIVPEYRKCAIEVLCMGIRDMAPYNFMPMQLPSLEFVLDGAEVIDKQDPKTGKPVETGEKTIRQLEYKIATRPSKRPTADNANFLERLVGEIQMPIDPIFAPPLKVFAKDSRLGGFMTPTVGKGTIHLNTKCPWDRASYIAPDLENFDTEVGENGELLPVVGDDETDAAKKAIMQAAGVAVVSDHEGFMDAQKMKKKAEDEAKRKAEEDRKRSSLAAMDEHMAARKARGSISTEAEVLEPMTLTEHVNFDRMIRDHVGAEDAGTGVFGSLHHTKNDLKPKKTRKKLTDPGEWVDEEEYDDPIYMKDRTIYQDELEAHLKGSPFETYVFSLGSKFGSAFSDPDYREVGKMKGLIRVMDNAEEPALLDLKEVLKPQSIKVRLYILRALKLAAMDEGWGDQPGRSDPYLKIELGKHVYDGRDQHFDDLVDVDFYTYIGLNTEIPGSGMLKIHVYDFDDFGGDDLIGSTVIDLEDRWFDKRWQALGRELREDDFSKGLRWDVKPIEMRSLYTPASGSLPQGTVEMWVELCRPAEDGEFPPADISLPPAVPCEARLIMFKAKECVAMDVLENMNDMYCRCWIEGTEPQLTDTHWRAKKGKASWNYRMKFDLNLVHNCTVLKFPYLHIQAWDADIIGSNDILAETVLDIGKPLQKVLKRQKAVEVFEDPPKPQDDEDIESDDEETEDEEEEAAAANPLLGKAKSFIKSKKKLEVKDEEGGSDEEGEETKDEDAGGVSAVEAVQALQKKQQEEKERQAAIEAGELDPDEKEETKKEQPVAAMEAGEPVKKKGKKPKKKKPLTCFERLCHCFCCCCYWMKGCCGFCPIAGFCQCCPICWDVHAAADDEEGAEADEDAMEMVTMIKENMGLGGTDPKNCTWLTMDKMDHETGVRNQMGKMCIGLKLLPKSIADTEPAGFGRNDPNTNPTLPPPVGRMKFSLNPFVMGSELCGPKLCAQFTCCLVCLGIMALLIFCQPVLNLFIAIFLG